MKKYVTRKEYLLKYDMFKSIFGIFGIFLHQLKVVEKIIFKNYILKNNFKIQLKYKKWEHGRKLEHLSTKHSTYGDT